MALLKTRLLGADRFNSTVLEAVGKCASPRFLQSLSTTKPYLRADTALLEGQARGIYRYGLRNIILPEGTQRMLLFLTEPGYPESVQLIAANYMARFSEVKLDSLALPLIRSYNKASDPRVRMSLALALGKTRQDVAKQTLQASYLAELDYRVKCNILRALGNFPEEKTTALVMGALDDANPSVAMTAARHLIDYGSGAQAVEYWRKAKDTTLLWSVQTSLYRAANKHIPPYFEVTIGRINQELRTRFRDATSPYEKAQSLLGLSEFGWNYRFIGSEGLGSTIPVIRTASAEAMANIIRNPKFEQYFGLGRRRVKQDLATYFVNAVKSGDVGMMAVAAEVLAEPALDLKTIIDSTNFLQQAMQELQLPQEVETYNALQKALDHFNGQPTTAKQASSI